ncbi:hypothetical protein FQR65_LT02412 [Abscondita terminalis]|nr:hypothetical protein FQR65_LT02412 [Abscondita terminalis]
MENIQIKLKTVTHLLKKYKENYHQLQIQEEKVGKQIQILDSVQVPMEKEFTATETIENGISQNHYVSISPDLEKPETVKAKITPKYIIFGISPLTPEEYELIPQYIHRRMGLDSINSFIEVINNSVSNKYQLLSKLASSLKGDKLKLYKEFKKQQNGTMKGNVNKIQH